MARTDTARRIRLKTVDMGMRSWGRGEMTTASSRRGSRGDTEPPGEPAGGFLPCVVRGTVGVAVWVADERGDRRPGRRRPGVAGCRVRPAAGVRARRARRR